MNSRLLIYLQTHTPHTPATHPLAKAQNVVQNKWAPPHQAQCMALTLASKHTYNIITLSLLERCPLSLLILDLPSARFIYFFHTHSFIIITLSLLEHCPLSLLILSDLPLPCVFFIGFAICPLVLFIYFHTHSFIYVV